ncbi:MAG TPA: thermonuclease family protein [Chitinophagales bacterium]|jgi:micrococcal nuclease|nr:thermonuclease family protein [Chitinophagales bacterium]HQV79231.1 thermonuclease family protein [Chitinophagales bacterium]HQW80031.1 thermonuclease family protein [Chitinophagales bacterium]HRB66465.1 thermonuclease family protein [Chitinophagales bacterium]HRB69114.1 thermonuclease family protein [Chitinophagales bacterium]
MLRYIEAKEPINVFTHYKVSRVVDGDGLFCYNIFNKKEIEIRLLGIDAPEIKRCRKLKQDERELHLPGQLLIELGYQSKNYLHQLLPMDTDISFISEANNEIDLFGRILAYVFISDGTCINQKLISDGFAKPYSKYYSTQLNKYQQLNLAARAERKGLYSIVNIF